MYNLISEDVQFDFTIIKRIKIAYNFGNNYGSLHYVLGNIVTN